MNSTEKKQLVDTLIIAQEVIIQYSNEEFKSRICWGILFLIFATLSIGVAAWTILNLFLAGVHLHLAFNEHQRRKVFQQDLEKLKNLGAEKKETTWMLKFVEIVSIA